MLRNEKREEKKEGEKERMNYFGQHNRLPTEQKEKVQTPDYQIIPVRDAHLWRCAGGLLTTAGCFTAHRLKI
jgi:hypothetical protein